MDQAPPIMDPLLGKTIAGRYFIEKNLGAGGMGAVYLARHVTLDKLVALKVLHGDFVRNPDLLERFLQEARAASRIRHENVIEVTDFGSTTDGVVFFAMEVLEGKDLHDLVVEARKARQALPWPRIRDIFLQVCAALSAAHACGVVHRDLKPENVYLIERGGRQDFVKLLDFGIAKLSESAPGERKLTRTGMLFGTPEYMAPEQARGEPVDHRADIYAMGCLLYLLIASRVPFEGESFMAVLSMHLGAEPPPIPPETFAAAGAPPAVARVIARAMAKERDQRFATIDEMMDVLEGIDALEGTDALEEMAGGAKTAAVAEKDAVEAPDSGASETALARVDSEVPVRARRGRPVLWLGVGLVLAAGAGLGMLQWMDQRAGQEGETAALAQAAAVPADALAAEPALPARVTLTLRSQPEGATILDGAGQEVGETPLSFELPGGRDPRRFRFRLAGHYDKLVELIPSEDVDHTVALVSRPDAGAGQVSAGEPEAEPEVEIVPQERARRRAERRRSRRHGREEPVALPESAAPAAEAEEAHPAPQPPEPAAPAEPAVVPKDQAEAPVVRESEAPAGAGNEAGGAGDEGENPPDEVTSGAADQDPADKGSTDQRTPEPPTPREPDPTSDPVLKNPFAQ